MDYEESDWDDDDFDDDDFDDDYDDDDESETIPCPSCGADIYEDAEACPHCGDYIHHGYSRGWWSFGGALDEWSPFWVLLAMAGVIAVVFSLMMFF